MRYVVYTNNLIGTCHRSQGALLPVPSVRYCRALARSFCRFLVVPGQDWYHVLFFETISFVRTYARCIRHSHFSGGTRYGKVLALVIVDKLDFCTGYLCYVTYAGF
jgi:hypothetical protein